LTETPLYRAARALMKSQSGVDDFDALDDEMQKGLLDDVRAVLAAVREPSEAMWDAGFEIYPKYQEEHWQAMIDAALAE